MVTGVNFKISRCYSLLSGTTWPEKAHITKCPASNLFRPLLTWIAPLWATTEKPNRYWYSTSTDMLEGQQRLSHSATQTTSPSSNTRSALNHSCAFGQGITILDSEGRRGRGGKRAREKSYGEVLSFITTEAQCCLEHGQRLKTL